MIEIKSHETINESYQAYLRDESKTEGAAEAIFFPENFNDAARLVRRLSEEGRKITVSGARTGVVGGAVPHGGALLSTEKLKRISGITKNGVTGRYLITAEAGVTLSELNRYVDSFDFPDGKKYFYPVNPTEPGATIGGMVSGNSSGSRSYKFGPTRNYICALKILLSSGEILNLSRHVAKNSFNFEFVSESGKKYSFNMPDYRFAAIKNNAGIYRVLGMDLLDIFIGSEGTLGIVLEAGLMLEQRPETELGIMSFFLSENAALAAVSGLRFDPDIYAIEYFDRGALDLLTQERKAKPSAGIPEFSPDSCAALYLEFGIEKSALEAKYDFLSGVLEKNGSSMDTAWGGTENREMEKLRNFRRMLPETVNNFLSFVKIQYPEIYKISSDIAVPQEKFPELMEVYRMKLSSSGLKYIIFGHVGECHLHMNILPHNPEEMSKGKAIYREIVSRAVELGGTISAEHGIGKIKREYLPLMYSETEISRMRMIKEYFDPGMLLNPGNIF